MIKADGRTVWIEGSAPELLVELTFILQSIRNCLSEEFDTKIVDESIAEAGRLAFMSEDELEEAAKRYWEVRDGKV